ncbi:MAG: hypothetical protein KDA42_09435 [Planctomycetales bacterium]|nr:hypothetical protein [Planctomycetales bacterium]
MSDRPSKSRLLNRFFTGVTEHAFYVHLGVADPPLVDYVAELLTRFCRHDQLFQVRSSNGRRLNQVVEMMQEARSRVGEAQREVHRHIGDFTLFWTGLYPEAVEKFRDTGKPDSLIDYRAQGKKAYEVASQIPASQEKVGAGLLARLSHEFELCAYGLGEVRREWERREGPDGLMPLWIN